jgi:hypothetical protein
VFERFTEEARMIVVWAQEESRSLSHNYIGTEHILLALLRDETTPAGRVLASLGVEPEQAREHVERIVGTGEEPPPAQIPFTPRAKKVLELALREALTYGHNWIGPEHILLGVARENEGVAARVLLDFGVDADAVRNRTIEMIGNPPPRPPPPSAPRLTHLGPGATIWLEGLAPVLDILARDFNSDLRREPDLGDLLLVLACDSEGLAGKALKELGIDLDTLWGTIERIRLPNEDVRRRLREVRIAKENALEQRRFEEAARLRDEERELAGEHREHPAVTPEVLQEMRRRLGLHD